MLLKELFIQVGGFKVTSLVLKIYKLRIDTGDTAWYVMVAL